MKNVIVVIGPGQIGQAIARRVGIGKRVLLADLREDNAKAAAVVMANAGYDVSTATVDVSSRDAVHALVRAATTLGDVTGLIHAAGVSPSQALPALPKSANSPIQTARNLIPSIAISTPRPRRKIRGGSTLM